MGDPRITYGCLPILAGVALILLGQHDAMEFLGSLGMVALGLGTLVLVVTDVDRH